LIKVTEFLLIVKKISKYSKLEINEGKIPPDVYIICSCIRNAFCLSYSIRKKNTFYLYILESNLIIKFDGKNLRYLGPDERSQSLLLEKALSLSNQRLSQHQNDWHESTPGIFMKNLPSNHHIVDFCDSLTMEWIVIFVEDVNSFPDFMEITPNKLLQLQENLFIFTLGPINLRDLNIIHLLSESKEAITYQLPLIKAVEDKILYINFQIDRLKEQNKLNLQ